MPSTGTTVNDSLFVSAPTPGEVNDATAFNPLGSILTKYDTLNFNPGLNVPRVYRYVQLHSGATAVKGGSLIWQDLFNNVVTSVGTAPLRNTICGVLQTANCTAGNYTWMQIAGPAIALFTAGATVAIGEQLISSATVSPQRIDRIAVGTAPTSGPFGVVISTPTNAAINGSAAPGTDIAGVWLNILYPGDR